MDETTRKAASYCALCFASLLVATGCGSGSTAIEESGNTGFGFGGQSALEIADGIYDGTNPPPAGFYTEPPRDPQFFYSTRHVKNTDVDSAARLNPQAPEFEICVTDPAEAQSLEQQTRPTNSLLLASNTTDQYYEFERDDPADPGRRALVRLLRCQWVDRSMVNLRAPTQAMGILNTRPVAPADLRLLAEYLFTFSIYNNADYWVMESATQAGSQDLTHRLTIAELQRGASSGCDLLVLFDWDFSTSPADGEVRQSQTTIWTQPVRRQGSDAADCD